MKKEEKNKLNAWQKLLVLLLIILIVVVVCFLLVPTILISLSLIWPKVFNYASASKELLQNVSYVVGLVSLSLGILSIYFAYISTKATKEQKEQQDNFITELTLKTNMLIKQVDDIKLNNNSIYNYILNLGDKQIQEKKNSDEEKS